MFKKGQLITGTVNNSYGITSRDALCIVDRTYDGGVFIDVTVVAHKSGQTYTGDVEAKYFELCTYSDYVARVPSHVLLAGYTSNMLMRISADMIESAPRAPIYMDKEKIGSYELTDEERTDLQKEIISLLTEYDYNPTVSGVNTIINEWIRNKGWLINLFKKHPNYNGKFQIVFDAEYERRCNTDDLYRFTSYMKNTTKHNIKEAKIGPFSFYEVKDVYDRLDNVKYMLRQLKSFRKERMIDSREEAMLEEEFLRWSALYTRYLDARSKGEIVIYAGQPMNAEDYDLWQKACSIDSAISGYTHSLADDYFVSAVNSVFPSVKAVTGQKTSRIVRKICEALGITKDANFEKEFAKYSDAINPRTDKRPTILSCHPIDYFTMSFGNSWASCHTIDKKNKRGMPNDYSGCYSSGTLSYMLDESSFVYYTVDKDYNGDKYELQSKIFRNMFHIGNDKLVQGRIYPQSTDGDNGVYKQIREIVCEHIAQILEAPNTWQTVKGTSACRSVIHSKGTHYTDYTNFNSCNVNYLLDPESCKNHEQITVGHSPICPHCGYTHNEEETIECSSCYEDYDNDEVSCCMCGNYYDRDNDYIHNIDGDWYCEDCCIYCAYHGRWEAIDPDEAYDIENYGLICPEAYDTGDFFLCDACDCYYRRSSSMVEMANGDIFCDSDCAENAGYVEVEGVWYDKESSEIAYCDVCEEYVLAEKFDFEKDCCKACLEEREVSDNE